MGIGINGKAKPRHPWIVSIARCFEGFRSFCEEFIASHAQQTALLILISVGVFLLLFWFATSGLPRIQDQTESFNSYLAAENLRDYGLWNLRLLEDWATSASSEAHPYLYTHNPDFPNLYSYLLLKIGITSLPYQNLTAIFILLLGFWYFYKAISSITESPLAGVIALTMAGTDYLGALVFGANLYRSWTWLLVWGTIYHWMASEHAMVTRKRKFHLAAAVVLYFSTVYYEYGVALLLTAIVLFLKLFRIHRGSWKRCLVFVFATGFTSFAAHTLLVISAVGIRVWLRDFAMTISNRALGTPPREVLEQFYSEHYMVLWGYPKLTTSVLRYFLTEVFPHRIETIFGTATLGIVVVSILITGFYLIKQGKNRLDRFGDSRRRHPALMGDEGSHSLGPDLPRQGLWAALETRVSTSVKFIVVLMLSYGVVFLVFPGQTLFLYIGPFVPFFVLLLDALRTIFLWALLQSSLEAIKKRMYVFASALLTLILVFVAHTALVQWRNFESNYPAPFGSSLVLDKYRGYSAVTNFQSPYVRYFTKEWVTVIGWFNEPIEEPFESRYTFERDKYQDPQKYQEPDFAILQAAHNQTISPQVTETLRRLYPAVETGDDYVIYDLRKKGMAFEPQNTGARAYAKIPLPPGSLTVSSVNSPGETSANLLDGNMATNWHVKFPVEVPEHRIIIDLGQAERIEAIAVMPNVKNRNQFWDQDHAVIQVRNEESEWADLAVLLADRAAIAKDKPEWLYYTFENAKSYRFYRIVIRDALFLSLAELEVYKSDSPARQ